jgi:prepilin peptidase CpaA
MQNIIFSLAIVLFAIVAYTDARTRRIPNELIVGFLALAAWRIGLNGEPSAALYTLAASTALFLATFLLFCRGLLGGGDVKLIAVTGLLIGYHDLFEFLFVMSVCGALVAVAIVAVDRFGLRPMPCPETTPVAQDHETPARLTVPYGVAIAAAGVFTLLVQTFVSR